MYFGSDMLLRLQWPSYPIFIYCRFQNVHFFIYFSKKYRPIDIFFYNNHYLFKFVYPQKHEYMKLLPYLDKIQSLLFNLVKYESSYKISPNSNKNIDKSQKLTVFWLFEMWILWKETEWVIWINMSSITTDTYYM